MRLPLLLKILTLSLLASSCESEAQEPVYQGITYPEEKQDGTLRILAIGNSFSLDMAAHLPRLVSDAKADSVVVAVASVSGTDLAYHRRHLTAYDATYTFATSTASRCATTPSKEACPTASTLPTGMSSSSNNYPHIQDVTRP